ncbi:hypothetical protein GCM10023075_53000 [Streptosporangium album]
MLTALYAVCAAAATLSVVSCSSLARTASDVVSDPIPSITAKTRKAVSVARPWIERGHRGETTFPSGNLLFTYL